MASDIRKQTGKEKRRNVISYMISDLKKREMTERKREKGKSEKERNKIYALFKI